MAVSVAGLAAAPPPARPLQGGARSRRRARAARPPLVPRDGDHGAARSAARARRRRLRRRLQGPHDGHALARRGPRAVSARRVAGANRARAGRLPAARVAGDCAALQRATRPASVRGRRRAALRRTPLRVGSDRGRGAAQRRRARRLPRRPADGDARRRRRTRPPRRRRRDAGREGGTRTRRGGGETRRHDGDTRRRHDRLLATAAGGTQAEGGGVLRVSRVVLLVSTG